MAFLNERISDCFSFGSGMGKRFPGAVRKDSFANSASVLRHPYPQDTFVLLYDNKDLDDMIDLLIDLYNRAGGVYNGFKIWDRSEWSTNDYTGVPTAYDQPCELVEAADSNDGGQYQIMVWYGTWTDSDCPRRRVLKPRSGTALVGFSDGVNNRTASDYSVDYSTGIITLGSDLPGSDEYLTAGCYFDKPVVFDGSIEEIDWSNRQQVGTYILSGRIRVVELLGLG